MPKTVKIRNLTLGEGIPKICIPIIGKTKEEVFASAKTAIEHQPDILEWRIDFFEAVQEAQEMRDVLEKLRKLLDEVPLLVTFRTRQEGGEQEMSPEEYRVLYEKVLATGLADAIDVELFLPETVVKELTEQARQKGVTVILSNHDFVKTPPKEELVQRLQRMQDFGADVAKIAVMPASRTDVLTLLSATEEAERLLGIPIITMSMGRTGVLSRLLGEGFGSALTFGMAGQASAPGQIPAKNLRQLLTMLHNIL